MFQLQLHETGNHWNSIKCVILYLFSSILKPIWLYSAHSLGLCSSATCMVIRSYVTKILLENESFKALSVVVMLESILSLMKSYYYSAIFRATISFCPTLSYQITSFFLIVAIIVFSVIDLNDHRKKAMENSIRWIPVIIFLSLIDWFLQRNCFRNYLIMCFTFVSNKFSWSLIRGWWCHSFDPFINKTEYP